MYWMLLAFNRKPPGCRLPVWKAVRSEVCGIWGSQLKKKVRGFEDKVLKLKINRADVEFDSLPVISLKRMSNEV
jgi:hypothetical protein